MMIYKENEILEIGKKVLKDLQGKYFIEKNIEKIFFNDERELIRGNDKGKIHPCWTISIDEPIFDTSEFLTISDETGKPLYFQNSHKVIEIEKDTDGNYKWKE